jgi:PKD repeat protein
MVMILVATGSALLLLGAAEARAVITEPIPADVGPAPPPIPALPLAGDTAPPSGSIADPITPEAGCGGWYRQSDYGARWPAGSTWWEYQCTRSDSVYHSYCTVGACNAFCPECWWESSEWTDYFYWDGSNAVFYGESYSYSSISEGEYWPPYTLYYWWDQPTARWYQLPPLPEEPPNATPTASFTLACSGASCSLDGSASSDSDGMIADYSWTFGDGTGASGATAEHAYAEPGTYTVTLTVTDDKGGWARDSKVVTIESSPPPPPNAPPTAAFTSSCSAPSCSFNASGSTDSDGAIAAYSWDFGDGTGGSGSPAPHTYAAPGTYTVTLTVTDDGGATATDSKSITVIGLTARAYPVKRLHKVDLTWNGPGGASFDVYRDGGKIATVTATAYTDNLGKAPPGSHTYQVCQAAVPNSTCSNAVTVTF